MTLEFAIKEAKRRTDVLGTPHFIYHSEDDGPDGYFITARVLRDFHIVQFFR